MMHFSNRFSHGEFSSKQQLIHGWFLEAWQHLQTPFYCSVDLRHAHYKLVPVDTNLFPAGFNNLAEAAKIRATEEMCFWLNRHYPGLKKIALIPENHTRNTFYYENLATLQQLLSEAGFIVRIGSVQTSTNFTEILLHSGRTLQLETLHTHANQALINDFQPDLILLNNDLADSIPNMLFDIKQPVIPSPNLGWSTRLKSNHFSHYQAICREFSDFIQVDPWLFNADFRTCSEINFATGEGEDCLIAQAEDLLQAIQKKYDQYGISQKPFIAIKAEQGTYGMGILMIDDPTKLRRLNRKERTRMTQTKGGRAIHQVILQEGVPTIDHYEHHVAEPVIYLVGGIAVGGFYRVHKTRTAQANLNAPGMYFAPLTLDSEIGYFYQIVAQLAALAAAREAV